MPSEVNAGSVSTNRGVGHRDQRVVGQPGHHDPAQPGLDRVAVGQPGAVRRPAQVGDLAVGPAGQLAQPGRRPGRAPAAARRGRRAPPPSRPGRGPAPAPGPAHRPRSGAAAARPRPARPAGRRRPRPRPRRRRPTPPGRRPAGAASRARTPGRGEQRAGRAVAVGEPVHGAADQRDAGAAGAVRRRRASARSAVSTRNGSRAVRGPPSRTSSRRGCASGSRRVQDPQLSRGLVDHPLAVGAGVPGVERGRPGGAVVGVPAQAGGRRRPASRGCPSPRGRRGRRSAAPSRFPTSIGADELPVQRRRASRANSPVPVGVPPQLAGRAAAVALPPGHVPGHRALSTTVGPPAASATSETGPKSSRRGGAAVGGDGVRPGPPR